MGSHAAGEGGAGKQPGLRARSTGQGGEAADPAAPFMQKIRAGLRPRRGRPRPLRPPPGPAFNTGPVSSSHSAHQMSSGRFQQKLRCGFHRALQRREPSARSCKGGTRRRAPRRPPRPRHPPGGRPARTAPPGPVSVRPDPLPSPTRARRLGATSPPAPGGLSWTQLRWGRAPTPTFYSRALGRGDGRLGRRAAAKPMALRGYFYFRAFGLLASCQDLIKAQRAPADSPGPGSGSQ